MRDYKRLTERSGEAFALKSKYASDNIAIWHAIKRLAELEDKIENGTLTELPEPTNKFAIVEYYGQKNKPLKIVEYRLFSYNLSTKKIEKLWYCSNTRFSIIVEDIATKPEAEAKLKELKGEDK